MNILVSKALKLAESGYIPDAFLRSGIRKMCRNRLIDIGSHNESIREQRMQSFVRSMNQARIAPTPEKANQQHYELPSEFFNLVLGLHQKYSCGYWNKSNQSLDESEEQALQLTCQYANIKNGHRILELGCGWGSLTLWIAQRYPASKITALSNSTSQRN